MTPDARHIDAEFLPDAAVPYNVLTDRVERADKELAPGSETAYLGQYRHEMHELYVEQGGGTRGPGADIPEDYPVPAEEAVWWLALYRSLRDGVAYVDAADDADDAVNAMPERRVEVCVSAEYLVEHGPLQPLAHQLTYEERKEVAAEWGTRIDDALRRHAHSDTGIGWRVQYVHAERPPANRRGLASWQGARFRRSYPGIATQYGFSDVEWQAIQQIVDDVTDAVIRDWDDGSGDS